MTPVRPRPRHAGRCAGARARRHSSASPAPPSAVSHSSAASQFSAAGISWTSSGGCSDPNNPTCTSFEGIRQATIDGAITLKNASGCSLLITGGTETGHAGGTYSHANGYKLDFSRTSCLTSWVHNTYTYIGLRSDGAPHVPGRLRQRLRRRGQPLGRHSTTPAAADLQVGHGDAPRVTSGGRHLNIPDAPAIEGATHLHSGKVRDLYRLASGDLLMVASDRISAFDFVLDTTIPDKGAVLTRMSLWWFEQLADLVPNHVVSTDVPDAVRGRAVVCAQPRHVPGRVRGPRLPHRLRPARLPRDRRGLRHRAARRARGRLPASRADLHARPPRRRSASTTRTSRTTRWSPRSAPTTQRRCAT